jgi:RNA-binding protein
MIFPFQPSRVPHSLVSSSLSMYDFPLTGAQKTYLRGLGQQLAPALKVGRAGLTPAFYKELQHALNAQELIKLRFIDADRDERATLCETIADEGRCVCVGAVGHTALFFRRQTDPQRQSVDLPGA